MILKYYPQEKEYSCGAAAMRIALSGLNIEKKEEQLLKLLHTSKTKGTNFKSFISLAKKLKLNFISKENSSITELEKLLKDKYYIIICYFNKRDNCHHYAVIKKIDEKNIYLLDPWFGKNHKYSIPYFKSIWKKSKIEKQPNCWFIAIK